MPERVATLASSRLSPSAQEAYLALLGEAHGVLDAVAVPADGREAWVVPGRIEVLGKHVDYAGGRSLLCAIDRGIVVVARRRDDHQVIMRDAVRRQAVSVPLDDHASAGAAPSPPWAVYPRTVVRRLARNFAGALVGADVAIASNLPSAAGVSSSSALVVGLVLALARLSRLVDDARWQAALPDRIALAGYLGAVENGFDFGPLAGEAGVGTLGGAQDQTAILCCAAGRLDQFAWAPVRHERSVPWPDTHRFVVGVSGVVAAKTGAARERYNRAARTAHHLVAAWNRARSDHGGHEAPARTLADAVREARRLAGDAPDAVTVPAPLAEAAARHATPEFSAAHLAERLHQFCEESWRWVPGAADTLLRGDLEAFGEAVAGSQAGAERALENQVAETRALVRIARELGAPAASAFGAGFGGSVWAMIPARDADAFAARWMHQYLQRFRAHATRARCFVTAPAPGAIRVEPAASTVASTAATTAVGADDA